MEKKEIEIQLGIEPRSSKPQSDALTIELLWSVLATELPLEMLKLKDFPQYSLHTSAYMEAI